MSDHEVAATVVTSAKPEQPAFAQRSISYPVTARSSVAAVQERSMRVLLTELAVSPVGAVGGEVSCAGAPPTGVAMSAWISVAVSARL